MMFCCVHFISFLGFEVSGGCGVLLFNFFLLTCHRRGTTDWKVVSLLQPVEFGLLIRFRFAIFSQDF